MIRSVMGGETFRYPAGTYVSNEKYNHIMMAMDTALDTNGCSYKMPEGTLEKTAKHNPSKLDLLSFARLFIIYNS